MPTMSGHSPRRSPSSSRMAGDSSPSQEHMVIAPTWTRQAAPHPMSPSWMWGHLRPNPAPRPRRRPLLPPQLPLQPLGARPQRIHQEHNHPPRALPTAVLLLFLSVRCVWLLSLRCSLWLLGHFYRRLRQQGSHTSLTSSLFQSHLGRIAYLIDYNSLLLTSFTDNRFHHLPWILFLLCTPHGPTLSLTSSTVLLWLLWTSLWILPSFLSLTRTLPYLYPTW